MATIPVIHSFARSGGTLLNQCLGCHPDNLILSEIAPACAYKPVAQQACEWLGLLEAGESAAFNLRDYPAQIAELHRRATAAGKHLILRDWSTVSFLPITLEREANPPMSGLLEQEVYLAIAGLEVKPVAFVRHAATVLLSIRRNLPLLANLAVEDFAPGYLRYAQAVAPLPLFQLESFTADPEAELQRISGALGIAYPATFREEFHHFDRCTGNNTLRGGGVRATQREIVPERFPQDETWRAIAANPQIIEANRLLGYAA